MGGRCQLLATALPGGHDNRGSSRLPIVRCFFFILFVHFRGTCLIALIPAKVSKTSKYPKDYIIVQDKN